MNANISGINNLSFYLYKKKFRKDCLENYHKKGVTSDTYFWYLPTYTMYAKILASVCDHVHQFYGGCHILTILYRDLTSKDTKYELSGIVSIASSFLSKSSIPEHRMGFLRLLAVYVNRYILIFLIKDNWNRLWQISLHFLPCEL